MKILLINYHYFLRGGPDRYLFNVKDALEKQGHTIVPFAFDYADTIETPYRKYFPRPITGKGPCMLSELSLSLNAQVKSALRMFHNQELNRKFRAIIRMERPDVVFSVYLSSTLLPNILKIAKEEFGLPILYRLSDFHMFCASCIFYRNGLVCADCLTKPWSAVRYGCVHQSKIASFLRVLQMKYFLYRGWYDVVDSFICPSKVMANLLIERGIPSDKVVHLPTFAKDIGKNVVRTSDLPYVLYFGRINRVKGAELLVKAFNKVNKPNIRLRIVGYIEPAYKKELFDCLNDEHKGLVDILPPEHDSELVRTIQRSLLVVHPSLWLENMPNSVLEAMSASKPVIASNLGSLPELVEDGVNGKLFKAGDCDALAAAIETLVSSPNQLENMGSASRQLYERKYSEAVHMQTLCRLLNKSIVAD